MKSRIITSSSEVRRLAKEEYLRLKDTVYENVIKDVIPQFMGVCMVILNRENGFGEKRLQRFLDSVTSEFEIMNRGVFGRNYDPLDCLKFLKDRYKIDVDKEFGND
ncbi:MAG: hypothetical protein NC320_00905 [Clostridium sp.]|nr:hypothetical protein [Clostridium sp.]